jgi:hypothetical protein
LRHINNIYDWLDEKTIKKLEGKRLRIICFTHAEMTRDFVREAFDMGDTAGKAHGRSQILEIRPKSKLRQGAEVETDIKVYPTKKHPGKETKVIRGFKAKR